MLLCEVEGKGEPVGEKCWGLIVAEASSFGSALRGLMGDELVFAVILHKLQGMKGQLFITMGKIIPVR